MLILAVIINIKPIFLGGNMYSQVIVSYDIENNKQRKKLYDELKDIGLKPIQKSVFWGYLLISEKRVVKELLKQYCQDNDKGFIVDAVLDKHIENYVGYSKDDFIHPESFEII